MRRTTIRRAGLADAARLALVAGATFLETFAETIGGDDLLAHATVKNGEAYYAARLAEPEHVLWLAEAAGTGAPVGFAMLSPPDLPVAAAPEDIELKRIYLFSAWHGGGTGRALMQAAVDEAVARGKRRLLLGVYSGNARAIGFYEAAGFERIGTRRFQVGAALFDDLVLARALGS